MRANIIIHSISGNLYIVASAFQEALQNAGVDSRLYRVEDQDLHMKANERNDVNEYYEEIIQLPIASKETLNKADVILLGTCSSFGLPSAEMVAFLDSTWALYEKQALSGKGFYGFSSSSISKEDGRNAVQGLYSWARLQGLKFIKYDPYVHKDGTIMPNRPSEKIDEIATGLASQISTFC